MRLMVHRGQQVCKIRGPCKGLGRSCMMWPARFLGFVGNPSSTLHCSLLPLTETQAHVGGMGDCLNSNVDFRRHSSRPEGHSLSREGQHVAGLRFAVCEGAPCL